MHLEDALADPEAAQSAVVAVVVPGAVVVLEVVGLAEAVAVAAVEAVVKTTRYRSVRSLVPQVRRHA